MTPALARSSARKLVTVTPEGAEAPARTFRPSSDARKSVARVADQVLRAVFDPFIVASNKYSMSASRFGARDRGRGPPSVDSGF